MIVDDTIAAKAIVALADEDSISNLLSQYLSPPVTGDPYILEYKTGFLPKEEVCTSSHHC